MTVQTPYSTRKWMIKLFFGLFILLTTACSRPNPNPELLDPIYSDLGQRSTVAKAGADQKKEEIKKLREELDALPPRDVGRKKMLEDLGKKEQQMLAAEQEALYYEIRGKQRKEYARAEYMKAYDKGEPWPNPADFETYKLQRKLRDAPRDWSARVPKTDRYNKKSPEDVRKALDEKLSAKTGGGH